MATNLDAQNIRSGCSGVQLSSIALAFHPRRPPVGKMLTVAKTAYSKSSASFSFIALYSTVSGLARRNWKITGRTPPSLVHTEYMDEPLPGKAARLRSKTSDEKTPRQFRVHRETLKKSFPEGWAPPRKLSREAMDGLRLMHSHDPERFTTPVLAAKFRISPEAVRRILKSKWEPKKEEREKLLQRERRQREEWIAQRRLEEKKTQEQLLKGRINRVDEEDGFSLR